MPFLLKTLFAPHAPPINLERFPICPVNKILGNPSINKGLGGVEGYKENSINFFSKFHILQSRGRSMRTDLRLDF